MTARERLDQARTRLSEAYEQLDLAATELSDLEAHAARELRGDIAETLRRLGNLIVFATRAAS